VGDDGSLGILDDTDSLRRVLRHNQTRAWKASEYNVVEPAAGDCVYARGTLDDERQLVLDTLWANIAKLEGGLLDINSRAKRIRLAKKGRAGKPQGEVDITVKDDTIVRGDDGRETFGNVDKLKKKSDVVLIAYSDPVTRTFTAHRVEAHEAFGAGQVSPEPSARAASRDGLSRKPTAEASTHFPIARRGNASFFCCGNVSGCGYSCGSSSGGYCGNVAAARTTWRGPKSAPAGHTAAAAALSRTTHATDAARNSTARTHAPATPFSSRSPIAARPCAVGALDARAMTRCDLT